MENIEPTQLPTKENTIAIRRKTGARGLRAILESVMMELMYEIPSNKTAREVVISEDVISKKKDPVILFSTEMPVEKSASK